MVDAPDTGPPRLVRLDLRHGPDPEFAHRTEHLVLSLCYRECRTGFEPALVPALPGDMTACLHEQG
ncbi:hypothetical protein GCM10010329_33180 [Streptomyces spiroverticillatus]|uniref:Uncharacterized protein n=1 Tax=Streptomyces finlayi TaxID=67296 RepID=A0A918WWR8_9ACTN|nr:hypothetical protein [Streptomyces finlayi]GHA07808.1 hypothetical protein GCM10010329_33180 [Streptomyces spiroverticillatus]GHC91015.1 hypothetical protein GCM10010334_25590 [Streptomyces finlayi]